MLIIVEFIVWNNHKGFLSQIASFELKIRISEELLVPFEWLSQNEPGR